MGWRWGFGGECRDFSLGCVVCVGGFEMGLAVGGGGHGESGIGKSGEKKIPALAPESCT